MMTPCAAALELSLQSMSANGKQPMCSSFLENTVECVKTKKNRKKEIFTHLAETVHHVQKKVHSILCTTLTDVDVLFITFYVHYAIVHVTNKLFSLFFPDIIISLPFT